MYPPHVRNILKLSASERLPEAFHEWCFTGEIRDDAQRDAVCGLCAADDVRFQFAIRNDSTNAELAICQICIFRYPIAVCDGPERLSPEEKKNFLHQQTVRLMHQTCKDFIRRVRDLAPDPSVEIVMTYYERNYELSPAHAAVLFMRVEPEELVAMQGIFSIQTRSALHKQEFGTLSEAERLSVWPALTQIQKKRLSAMGLAPRQKRRQPASRRLAARQDESGDHCR